MNIALTGDVMLGRLVDRHVIQDEHVSPAAVWGDVLPLLLAADLRLINLECVISTRGNMWHPRRKPFHFRAHPRAIDVLKAARIDCVTLANNHTLDYGPAALAECLALLDQAGIRRAGAGQDLSAAITPALLQTAAGSISVIALTDNEPQWEAAHYRPGVQFVAYNAQGLLEPYRSQLIHLIEVTRRAAAWVIISAHVGPNWGAPSAVIRALAHELIDLGADLYWGIPTTRRKGWRCTAPNRYCTPLATSSTIMPSIRSSATTARSCSSPSWMTGGFGGYGSTRWRLRIAGCAGARGGGALPAGADADALSRIGQ
jgi:poly-gamma-glutamate synthesis protein (capsule biosynthesis protein)